MMIDQLRSAGGSTPSCVSVAEPENEIVWPTCQTSVSGGVSTVADRSVAAHIDLDRVADVERAALVRDLEADLRRALHVVGEGRRGGGGVVVLPVPSRSQAKVSVSPGCAGTEPVPSKVTVAARLRSSGWSPPRSREAVLDLEDVAAIEVRVIHGAIRSDLEVDGTVRIRGESDTRGRIGIAAAVGEHDPHAPARVVREEERAVVVGRVVAGAPVECHPRDGGTAGRASVPGHHAVAVQVGEERRRREPLRRADVQPRKKSDGALETGPAVIACRRDVRNSINLFIRTRAHVGHPDVVGAGLDDHAERIAEPVGDDALLVGVGAAEERVSRGRVARRRIDSKKEPFNTRGSPAARRRLWARSAPPSAVG